MDDLRELIFYIVFAAGVVLGLLAVFAAVDLVASWV